MVKKINKIKKLPRGLPRMHLERILVAMWQSGVYLRESEKCKGGF